MGFLVKTISYLKVLKCKHLLVVGDPRLLHFMVEFTCCVLFNNTFIFVGIIQK